VGNTLGAGLVTLRLVRSRRPGCCRHTVYVSGWVLRHARAACVPVNPPCVPQSGLCRVPLRVTCLSSMATTVPMNGRVHWRAFRLEQGGFIYGIEAGCTLQALRDHRAFREVRAWVEDTCGAQLFFLQERTLGTFTIVRPRNEPHIKVSSFAGSIVITLYHAGIRRFLPVRRGCWRHSGVLHSCLMYPRCPCLNRHNRCLAPCVPSLVTCLNFRLMTLA